MAKKKLTGEALDAYYDEMAKQKVRPGLTLATALEVTARQRAEDEANKVVIEVEDASPEESAQNAKPKKS